MSVDKLLVRQRLAYIDGQRQELARMSTLPLPEFIEPRNAAAAETFLRRSLEAVLDIGRHILAKTGRGELAQEYKSIARGLGALGAVSESLAAKLVEMAGYRNRLVHLSWEVTADELYRIIQPTSIRCSPTGSRSRPGWRSWTFRRPAPRKSGLSG